MPAWKIFFLKAIDAWIEVSVPDEQEEAVHDALIQRAHEIFMEEGYDIGVHVTERSAQQKCAANEEAGPG